MGYKILTIPVDMHRVYEALGRPAAIDGFREAMGVVTERLSDGLSAPDVIGREPLVRSHSFVEVEGLLFVTFLLEF